MLVYRIGGNPTSRRNTNTYKQVGRDLLFLSWSIDVFVSFLVFVSSLETIFCALAFVEVPPQLRRKAQQTIPRLVPHFLTAFPLEKDGCQHSSSSPFLAGNHEYTFEDWRERTKKITGLAKTRSGKSPVFFFRISFSYNVFVLFFLFSLKSNNAPFCFHGNCSSQMKVVPFVRAYSYSGL